MSSGERVGAAEDARCPARAAGRRGTSWESSRSQSALALKALKPNGSGSRAAARGRGGAGTSPALNQPPRDPEARLLSARKAHEGGRGAGPSLPPRAAGRQQHSPTPVQAKGPRPPGLGAGRWRGVGGRRSPALLLPGPRLRSPRAHGELVADMQVCRRFLKQGGPCAPRGKGGGGRRAGRGRCTALPDDGQPWGRLHRAGVAGSGRHRRGHAGRVAVPRLDRSLGRPALGLTSPEARSQVTQRRLYESSRKA